MPPSRFIVRHILILKSDRFCADVIRQAVTATFPRARVTVYSRVSDARRYFTRAPCDLLVSGLTFPDGGLHDWLNSWERSRLGACRVLVVTANPRPHMVRLLRELSVTGLFDTGTEDAEDLSFALMNVSLGLPCLSTAILANWLIRPPTAPAPVVHLPNRHALVANL